MPNRCRSNYFTFLTDDYAFIRLVGVFTGARSSACHMTVLGNRSDKVFFDYVISLDYRIFVTNSYNNSAFIYLYVVLILAK